MGKNVKDSVSSKDNEDKLTDYEITMNIIKQENMFKGTIAICIIYAIFGFILLICAYSSENIRDLLFNKFLPFTIVYIIGTILIIFIMLYYIFTFKPVKINNDTDIDDISCPDYWDVKIIDSNLIKDNFDSNYINDFKYKCVMSSNIFNKQKIFENSSNSYRITNNYYSTNKTLNNNGKYDINSNILFDADYKNNSKYYNLYVDLNDSATINNRTLSKDLDIYNNKDRLYDVISNLNKIALLENNYSIDKNTGNATDLIRSNINYNPEVSLKIWNKDNALLIASNSLASDTNNNYINIIDWGKYSNNRILYNTIHNDSSVNSIKICALGGSSNYCLGILKIDSDTCNIKFDAKNGVNWSNVFNNNIDNNVKDSNNYIIKSTKLYKWTGADANKFDDVTNSNPQAGNVAYDETNTDTIKLQIYNRTKFRPDYIPNDNIYKNASLNNGTNYISPLLCDSVYPKLLSRFEKLDKDNTNNNQIRCAYSKLCGIPWSDLKCNFK